MNERELFLAALEFDDLVDRKAHVQSCCGQDAELRARVESLLEIYEEQSEFLQTPVVEQLAPDDTFGVLGSSLTDGASAEAVMAGNTGGKDSGDLDRSEPTVNPPEVDLSFLSPTKKPEVLGCLGAYEISEVLGAGAFGIVLKGFDEKLKRVVAIKVLAPEIATTSPARKRFLREACASASVRHKNVVRIYDVEEEPIPFLVMEYIPGQTLQQRLDQSGPFSVEEVLRLGRLMADGLAAAHAQGLIHRDVKPGNILLDCGSEDCVKITDFGLARAADDASMTQSGMISGTPMYMAPEQVMGQRLDHRADLFSLGSVLYQMISGRPPFRASTTLAVLRRVADDTPRPITEVIPETPGWLCQIISHLHAKDPEQRFNSAEEVSDLLGYCLGEVRAGRIPELPQHLGCDTDVESAKQGLAPRAMWLRRSAFAALVLLTILIGWGLLQPSGLAQVVALCERMVVGSGTLVVRNDDPTLSFVIDGQRHVVGSEGETSHRLTSGAHVVTWYRDNQPVHSESVVITRGETWLLQPNFESDAFGNPDDLLTAEPMVLWGQAPYTAFSRLVRFHDCWYSTVREGTGHTTGPGTVRILKSNDGVQWESAGVLEMAGTDLREAGLTVTPDGRLMLNGGGAFPASRDPVTEQFSFVCFSDDGHSWSEPQRILEPWEWLWSLTWHGDWAYGVAYGRNPDSSSKAYEASLYRSRDGVQYERVSQFNLPGACEADLEFVGDTLYCLLRRDGSPNPSAMFGTSQPPYAEWNWQDLGTHIAGPDLLLDPRGDWWVGGRFQNLGGRTGLYQIDPETARLDLVRILPSGGDNGYPAMVWFNEQLWVSYTSSHEGSTRVYLLHGKAD